MYQLSYYTPPISPVILIINGLYSVYRTTSKAIQKSKYVKNIFVKTQNFTVLADIILLVTWLRAVISNVRCLTLQWIYSSIGSILLAFHLGPFTAWRFIKSRNPFYWSMNSNILQIMYYVYLKRTMNSFKESYYKTYKRVTVVFKTKVVKSTRLPV